MALSISGTPAAAAAMTITLPTHAVGNIIVIGAGRPNNTQTTKPAAGGTVPTWTDIDANAGANSCSLRTAYTVATATNHTSGTWTGAGVLVAIVISGQAASPIGGHLESGGTSASLSTAPAVTMTKTDGTSFLLEFHAIFGVSPSFSAAPTGYTRQASAVTAGTNFGLCLNTKDSTTSDGSVDQATSANSGYRGSTVEILALAAAARLPGSVLIGQAINRASRF